MFIRTGVALVFAACIVSASSADDPIDPIQFFDGTFDDGDWASELVVDTTPGQDATFDAYQVPNGGSPGAYREVFHSYEGGTIIVGHLREGAVYDPAVLGEIADVSVEYNLKQDPPSGYAVRVGLMIRQDGAYYACLAGSDLVWEPTWTGYVHGNLTALNFELADENWPGNGIHPNFSGGAAPIEFGYFTFNHQSGGPLQVRWSGIDTWTVTVLPAGEPVPVRTETWGQIKEFYRSGD